MHLRRSPIGTRISFPDPARLSSEGDARVVVGRFSGAIPGVASWPPWENFDVAIEAVHAMLHPHKVANP